MLERWGKFVVRRPWHIVLVALLAALGAGFAAFDLPDRLSLNLFEHPGSDSYRGRQVLERTFGRSPPNLVLVVTARAGSVDDPAVVSEADQIATRLAAEPGVADVASYWSLGRPPPLRNTDGNRALIVARVLGDDRQVNERLGEIAPRYQRQGTAVEVQVGGLAHALHALLEQTFADFKVAEIVTLPLTMVALLFVFGSVVAAALPLMIAIGAALGTALGLWILSGWTDITFFAPLLTSALSLGLGIDYSLFMVSRFREEMAAGHPPDQALVRTMRTAGRTVLFSAAAVTIALAALVLFPIAFIRALGYALMLTGLSAGVAAIVVLPAVLMLLGPRVNQFTVWRRSASPEGSGRWHRLAVTVMRRPLLVGGTVVALLLVAGVPVLRLDPGLTDDRDLPAGSEARRTGEILRTEFTTESATPISVVLPGTDAGVHAAELDSFAQQLARLPHVDVVIGPTGQYAGDSRAELPIERTSRYISGGTSYLDVLTDAEPLSAESNRLVDAIRALPRPFPEALVTGDAATRHDVMDGVMGTIPLALGFIVFATMLALFVQFGSVLVPLKAILLNGLSLTALFGILVWVFQDGNLSGLLDFTATGQLYIAVLLVLVCLAFGLSMDYELFILSRIKEEYDRTGDNEAAVAMGLERSGRIVSAAAVLIAVCFLSVGLAGSINFNKMFGIGLALVVLLDAFVIRGTLVPAFMKLAGRANWWAPRPLRSLHDRIGVSERVELEEEPAERAPALRS